MNWKELLTKEIESTYAVTEGLLDLVDEDSLQWKPGTGNNWMTTGQLLKHISNACGDSMRGFVTTLLAALVLAAIFTSVFSPHVYARSENHGRDMLIRNQVETAVSMLNAVTMKARKGDMTIDEAKKLGAELLRELRYGEEGYFWADTVEGVNVVLYGKEDVEGRSRIDAKDANGVFFIREFIAKAKAGGGYVEYLFPKKGGTTPVAKRSYVKLFAPFDWVVGTGYYPGKH